VTLDFLPPTAADDAALVHDLTRRINAAYGAAEEELWVPGKDRIARERVAEILGAGELAVATVSGRIVGSVRVRDVEEEAGYLGLLAVEPESQGAGIGGGLVEFAEAVSRGRGAAWMELRLLVPRDGRDVGKSRLYDWYVRLGYEEVERGDFGQSHPAAMDEWRTPLDMLTMRKRL